MTPATISMVAAGQDGDFRTRDLMTALNRLLNTIPSSRTPSILIFGHGLILSALRRFASNTANWFGATTTCAFP